MVSDGNDGFGSTKSGFQATVFCSERALAIGALKQALRVSLRACFKVDELKTNRLKLFSRKKQWNFPA